MFFPKFLKVATITLFFSNPFWLESFSSHRFPFLESAAQAQTIFTSSSQVEAQWQTMTSKEANFTVLMPLGNPKQEVLKESSGQFQVQLQSFALSDENGIYYWVTYTNHLPFAPESLTSDQAEVFYNGFTQGLLGEDSEAKVISKRQITLKGVIGQEMEIETSNGSSLKIRVFLKNSRIYILMVGIPTPSLAKSSNITQFLDSFDWVDGQVPVISKKSTSKNTTQVYSSDQSLRLK